MSNVQRSQLSRGINRKQELKGWKGRTSTYGSRLSDKITTVNFYLNGKHKVFTTMPIPELLNLGKSSRIPYLFNIIVNIHIYCYKYILYTCILLSFEFNCIEVYIFSMQTKKRRYPNPKSAIWKIRVSLEACRQNLDNKNANKCFAHARRVRNQEASLVSKCSQFFTKSQQYTGRSTWPYT